MKKLLLFVCFLAIISFFACNEENKYSVTIRVEKDGVADCTVYAKICEGAGQDVDCTAKYQTTAAFTNGAATISINDVEEGTYTAGLFIDVNDNNSDTYIPDCVDDWAIGDDNKKIDDDINETITSDDDGWVHASSAPWCNP